MTKKYVYIFTNSNSKDIIKIGKTDKYPESRAEQLNRQTGTIGKYEVAWFKEVEDNNIVEQVLHFTFNEFHVDKEYFRITSSIAISISENVIKSFFQNLIENKLKISNEVKDMIEGLRVATEFSEGQSLIEMKELISVLEKDIKTIDSKLQKYNSV